MVQNEPIIQFVLPGGQVIKKMAGMMFKMEVFLQELAHFSIIVRCLAVELKSMTIRDQFGIVKKEPSK